MNSDTETAAIRRGCVTPTIPCGGVAGLVEDQRDLGRLARAGGAFDDDDLVALERRQDLLPLLVDGQAVRIHAELPLLVRSDRRRSTL